MSDQMENIVVPDNLISAEFESIGIDRTTTKNGTVFFLSIRNRTSQQVRVKLPLTSYVRQDGQVRLQDRWATGVGSLINGGKGTSLPAGTFCRVGLIYAGWKFIGNGDVLSVTIEQSKPQVNICFTFKCTNAVSDTFVLIKAAAEELPNSGSVIKNPPAMVEILDRLTRLEGSLSEVLYKLDSIRNALPSYDAPNIVGPSQTQSEVLAWLATQDRISVSELRLRLLPLDLLPGAVINELNEKALDLTGELALKEIDDEIIIINEIICQVIKNPSTNKDEG